MKANVTLKLPKEYLQFIKIALIDEIIKCKKQNVDNIGNKKYNKEMIKKSKKIINYLTIAEM